MSWVGTTQIAQFQRQVRGLLRDTCTLYQPGAGTNSYGDPITVPVVAAANVPCQLAVPAVQPDINWGALPSEDVVPVLRIPADQPALYEGWAQLSGSRWYTIVGAPPVPTDALTRHLKVEPTRAPEGAP